MTALVKPMEMPKGSYKDIRMYDDGTWVGLPLDHVKPMTNADRIRSMTDEELAFFIAKQRFAAVNPMADKFEIDVTLAFIEGCKNALYWLTEEVAE